MPEQTHDEGRLVSYLMDELEPGERLEFERHMSGCPTCLGEARSLGRVTGMLATMAPATSTPDLKPGVLAALERAAGEGRAVAAPPPHLNGTLPAATGDGASSGNPRRRGSGLFAGWPARAAFAGALAAVVAAVVIVIGSNDAATTGPVEIQGSLTGASEGEIVVTMLGSGREVELTSSGFPILPKGEAYEVWFVGAGDDPADPNRISAGTFHPDEEGNTDVILHAAVDPALYPLVEVTAEPPGGDPAVEGDVVASLDGSSQLP